MILDLDVTFLQAPASLKQAFQKRQWKDDRPTGGKCGWNKFPTASCRSENETVKRGACDDSTKEQKGRGINVHSTLHCLDEEISGRHDGTNEK